MAATVREPEADARASLILMSNHVGSTTDGRVRMVAHGLSAITHALLAVAYEVKAARRSMEGL
jgi:tetrahydromethanopterin S-methyltransferase subunit H